MPARKEKIGVRLLDPLTEGQRELVRLWLMDAHKSYLDSAHRYEAAARDSQLSGAAQAAAYNYHAARAMRDMAARIDPVVHARRRAGRGTA